jgi:5,10-methylenetetrahydromethanopterin reductase
LARVRLALGFNPVLTVRDAVGLGQRAEALGYDSVWFHESLYQRDVISYLSAILLATSRLSVGSGAMNTFTRHPITAAATFATLSETSGGRVRMGLGLGSFPTVPKIGFKIFPVSETQPLKRISEYVNVMKSYWAGEKLAFKGEFFTADGLQSDFRLANPIPLYIASLSPHTQRFAGSRADGALLSPALATIETTSAMVRNVQSGESAAGRRVDRASYMLTSVDEDGVKARNVVKNFYFFLYQLSEVIKPEVLEAYGVKREQLDALSAAWKSGSPQASGLVPDAAVDALAVAGTAAEARRKVEEYREAGVDLPILMPIGNVNYAIESLAPD